MSISHSPICRWLLLVALLPWALPAAAGWLIATDNETAQAGGPLLLEAVKPATLADWPATLTLRLTQAGITQEVSLTPTAATTTDNIRRTYRSTVPPGLSGMVRAELVVPARSGAAETSNRLALVIANPSAAARPRPRRRLPRLRRRFHRKYQQRLPPPWQKNCPVRWRITLYFHRTSRCILWWAIERVTMRGFS
jgi:hypothetical protein